MKITKDTYEAFLLDLMEGNISPEDERELMSFLDKHPELKVDLEDFDLPELDLESEVFDNKDSLKKVVDYDHFSNLVIEEIEGEISKENQADLKGLLNLQPELKKDYDLYQKTILPKEAIVYPFKEELKKEAKVIGIGTKWVKYASAIAASVALLLATQNSDTPDVYHPTTGRAPVASIELSESNTPFEFADITPKETIQRINIEHVEIAHENGDTSELFYRKPIELIAEYHTNGLFENKQVELVMEKLPVIAPIEEKLTLKERAIAEYTALKNQYIPNGYEDLSRLEQISLVANKLGEVTKTEISMNVAENNSWSLQMGKFEIKK